jgi:hypothetical protein
VQLLLKLRAEEHNNWRHLITGDESWFYYEYVRERLWTARNDKRHQVENRIIPSRKSMPSVLWNSHGFHVMTMLHARASFASPWFIDQNLILLVEKFFSMGEI